MGAFFGVLLNGYLVGKFGQKRVLLGALVVLSAFITITFAAPNIEVLLVGEFLCGLLWGIFATTGQQLCYVLNQVRQLTNWMSQVLPTPLRSYLCHSVSTSRLIPTCVS